MGDSIFGATDPFDLTRAWMVEATATEPNDPNAMALASVDSDGMPDVRIVLLKEVEAAAFVFYTNYDSAKGEELDQAGKAALVLHWKTLRRQVRVRGTVTRVSGTQSDAYFATRALDSRLGAWASHQSQPLDSRRTLIDAVESRRAEFGEAPPRPPHWGGYRIAPTAIEFWQDGEFRLHDREVWHPAPDGWMVQRLYP